MNDEYEKFAQYYDIVGWGDFSNECYVALNTILFNENLVIDSLLDLGCGTGEFIKKCIEGYGSELIIEGLDKSEAMLEVARKKIGYNDMVLHNQDMIEMYINKKYDCVTCFFDTINHINDKKSIAKIFKKVYNITYKGGIFIFDIVTTECVCNWKKRDCITIDNIKIERKIDYNTDDNIITSTLEFELDSSTMYKVDVTEKVYSLADIKLLLEQGGFSKIKVYDEKFCEYDVNGSTTRVFVSARVQ